MCTEVIGYLKISKNPIGNRTWNFTWNNKVNLYETVFLTTGLMSLIC